MARNQTNNPEFVVFDFDHTMVATDTAVCFHQWLIRRSVWRSCLMLPLFPVMQTLRQFDSLKKSGLNIGCFVATVFQVSKIQGLKAQFIEEIYLSKKRVFPAAIEEAIRHKAAGRKVIVISGCPQWLLEPVINRLDLPVDEIIGSESKEQAGALVLDKLCYGGDKLVLATRKGIDFEHCHSCYSDCLSDIPLLSKSRYPFLVNGRRRSSEIPSELATRMELLEWQL